MSYKPLNNGNNQLKIVCVYFVHGNVLLTWVSDTCTCTLPLVSDTRACTDTLPLVSDTRACTLPLVSDTRACVVRSPPNISSKTCHRTLWAALRSHRPCCQAAENSAKKKLKGDVKNLFLSRKIRHDTAVPLAYLRLLAYLFLREI